MVQEVLMERTISKMKQLSTKRIHQVNDFVEFISQRADNDTITKGLQQLSSVSENTYDFLDNEPEIYTVNDLIVRYV
jgi:hypothetical protein